MVKTGNDISLSTSANNMTSSLCCDGTTVRLIRLRRGVDNRLAMNSILVSSSEADHIWEVSSCIMCFGNDNLAVSVPSCSVFLFQKTNGVASFIEWSVLGRISSETAFTHTHTRYTFMHSAAVGACSLSYHPVVLKHSKYYCSTTFVTNSSNLNLSFR